MVDLYVPKRQTGKYSAEEVFRKRGTVMPVLAGGPDAETLRQRFDRPEDVAILSESMTGREILCHVRDKEYLEERHQKVSAILREFGITTPKDLQRLSVERILGLRKIIKERLGE